MTETLTLDQVLEYLTGHADDAALDVVLAMSIARRKTLADAAAKALAPGVAVRLLNLKSGYLNGLTGTLTDTTRRGGRARPSGSVLLDEASTARIRTDPHGRTAGLFDPELGRMRLDGMPLECMRPI